MHIIKIMHTTMQYSGLANEVQRGRGKVPVADYQVAEYVNGTDKSVLSSMEKETRSCYSFCMCPGGQVLFFILARYSIFC